MWWDVMRTVELEERGSMRHAFNGVEKTGYG